MRIGYCFIFLELLKTFSHNPNLLFLENIYKALLEDKQRSSVGMFDVHINIHLFKHQITSNNCKFQTITQYNRLLIA